MERFSHGLLVTRFPAFFVPCSRQSFLDLQSSTNDGGFADVARGLGKSFLMFGNFAVNLVTRCGLSSIVGNFLQTIRLVT